MRFLLLLFAGAVLCAKDAQKVVVEVAIESLCPDCRDVITGSIWEAFRADGLLDIMDLRLYPYGNAKQQLDQSTGLWKFTCQHGEKECQGNLMQTCAINIVQNMTVLFPWFWCMERSTSPIDFAPRCASQFGIPWAPIQSCVSSPQGNAWEHQMGAWTDNLSPAHTEVPWFVVNGAHDETTNQRCAENLIGVVCGLYQGPKPAGCGR
ncbi:putative Gamma-interferon-inducible lysosomal thiol reductase [Paratrimastix pyriformis]|uniref:Gamma-interferon-inducible lysosomal thiol reductase n=1 Tax=Paratrimastix pyriformis TaxID=342808 RepID=A0ABQ8ULA7_9EUKA|nr:putative Gamma-interferon-inducible lysosomal thiol reductase [Paratrimastix pyriformis]